MEIYLSAKLQRLILLMLFVVLGVSEFSTLYADTFSDNFDDGDVDGWTIDSERAEPIRVLAGAVLMDTIKGDLPLFSKAAWMELAAVDTHNWDDYTLTCRVKFSRALKELLPVFSVHVRRSLGQFDVMAEHVMLIFPLNDQIAVSSTPPDAQFIREVQNPKIVIGIQGIIGRGTKGRPVRLDKWYTIKIIAMQHQFEFFFNKLPVSVYEDQTAVPGTVKFQAGSGVRVFLDDVVISGPNIPDRIARAVQPTYKLATTWGEIKQN